MLRLDPGQSYAQHRLRVLILPVGKMPESTFDFYASVIERAGASVSIANLPGAPESAYFPSRHPSATVGMEFLRAHPPLAATEEHPDAVTAAETANRRERRTPVSSPSAAGPETGGGGGGGGAGGLLDGAPAAPWEWLRVRDPRVSEEYYPLSHEQVNVLGLGDPWAVLRAHLGVWAVICVCHCPSTRDLASAYEQFVRMRARFQSATQFRCYAFEPSEDQEDHAEREDWTLFPNQRDRLDFYLATFMDDLTSRLLEDLHAQADQLMTFGGGSGTVLSTPLDSDKVDLRAHKFRKLRTGRIEKRMGDLCMLAGSPVDANEHYNRALEATKSTSDWVWNAAAWEGVAAAIIAQNIQAQDDHFSESVADLFRDALNVLAKKQYTTRLRIETYFRLARYYAHYDRFDDAAEAVSHAVEISQSSGALDRVAVLAESALICDSIGMHRKFAFYLRRAAMVYLKLHQINHAHKLFSMSWKVYQRVDSTVQDLLQRVAQGQPLADERPSSAAELAASMSSSSSLTQTPSSLVLRRLWERGQLQYGRWVHLQQSLLEKLIDTSRALEDNFAVASYIVLMLRTLYPWLDRDYQRSLAAELESATRIMPLNTRVEMHGMPHLVAVRPVLLNSELEPLPGRAAPPLDAAPQLDRQDSNDVFIFTPTKDVAGAGAAGRRFGGFTNSSHGHSSKAVHTMYVSGETMYVEVYLSNPLEIELLIQRITLSVDGVLFEAYPESLTLSPHETMYRVLLSGKPLEHGEMTIRGCWIRTFNLMHEHRVDETGRGLPVLQEDLHSQREVGYATDFSDYSAQGQTAPRIFSIFGGSDDPSPSPRMKNSDSASSLPDMQQSSGVSPSASFAELSSAAGSASGDSALFNRHGRTGSSLQVEVTPPSRMLQLRKGNHIAPASGYWSPPMSPDPYPAGLPGASSRNPTAQLAQSRGAKRGRVRHPKQHHLHHLHHGYLRDGDAVLTPISSAPPSPGHSPRMIVSSAVHPLFETTLPDQSGQQLPSLFGPRPNPSPSRLGAVSPGGAPPSAPEPPQAKRPQLPDVPIVCLQDVPVVPPVPQVVLRFEFNGNMEGDLFIGENRVMSLFVQNVGQVEVAEMSLEIRENFVSGSTQHQATYYSAAEEEEARQAERAYLEKVGAAVQDVELDDPPDSADEDTQSGSNKNGCRYLDWDENALKPQLPLPPGRTATILLHLHAHPSSCGAEVLLKYGTLPEDGEEEEHDEDEDKEEDEEDVEETAIKAWHRCTSRTIRWSVSTGLVVRSIDISPLVASSTQTSPEEVNRKLLNAITDASGSGGLIAPDADGAETAPLETQPECMLILEVENTADTTFRVQLQDTDGGAELDELGAGDLPTSTDSPSPRPEETGRLGGTTRMRREVASVFIEKRCTKRVILPVSRFSFGARDDDALRKLALFRPPRSASDSKDRVHSSDNLRYVMERLSPAFQRCKTTFFQRVRLTWSSADKTHGRLDLNESGGFFHPWAAEEAASLYAGAQDVEHESFTQRRYKLLSSVREACLSAPKLYRIVPDPFTFQFMLTGGAPPPTVHRSTSLSTISGPPPRRLTIEDVLQPPSDLSQPDMSRSLSAASQQSAGDDMVALVREPICSISAPMGSSIAALYSMTEMFFPAVSSMMDTSAESGGRRHGPAGRGLSSMASLYSPFSRQRKQKSPAPLSPSECGLEVPEMHRNTSASSSGSSSSRRSSRNSRTHAHRGSIAGLGGAVFSTDRNNCYPVGNFKSIYIAVNNNSEQPLFLDLLVRPYQETVNGGLDTNLQHKLMWVGSLQTSLPPIPPRHTFVHRLLVCFVSIGRFQFQVCCKPRNADPPPRRLFSPSPFVNALMKQRADAAATSSRSTPTSTQPDDNDDSDIVYFCNRPLVIEAM